MAPALRKFVLAAHLAFSLGWIGAVIAYLALGISAAASQDALTVRAAWIAMELTGWYVIVPLALAALISGLVISIGTKWGLFRHYWVVTSLALTIFATVVLLLHMPTVSVTADVAREADAATLEALGGDLHHPGIGLVVLLLITGLNVYKPKGMTRYGRRKQREEARYPSKVADQSAATSAS